ncbi:MAG: glycosyltransferase family 2 protein [Planctomycetota bacterium]|jgi:glycosyltransferase involved in cell wall biosynthesis
MDQSRPACRLSVIAPARNEQASVGPLVAEIEAALDPLQLDYELIIVDDGSSDGTLATLAGLRTRHDALRVLRLTEASARRGAGQSAAFRAGILASRGDLVAMMDADGQNDPADLPRLLARLTETGADLVQGDRVQRRDSLVKRAASNVGRLVRRWLLADDIRDTGCSLRIMRRTVALELPLELRGMHRFIPVTARHLGYHVVELEVSHRPRTAGRTKYGIWNRALPGLIDCLAVRWMHRRRRATTCDEIVHAIGHEAAPVRRRPAPWTEINVECR